MKKTTIITLFLTILFFAGCVRNQSPEPVKPAQITLSEIGTSGSLHHDASAWEVLELTDYDLWVLYIKKDRLASHLNSGDAYAVLLDGQNVLLESNPFNANILKLLLPSQDKPKDLLSVVIKPINARESGMMKNDIPLAIEKIYITKEKNNGTLLNEITVVDYTDMYADSNQNSFAWDNGSFIRPSHVKSNEENAYAVNTYFDARTAAVTESATGAFQFLKEVDNYEQYITMENPNRFRVTDGATQLLAPDDRWRVRQLGESVFNIVEEPLNQQFILSIDTDTLPATYNGTIFWLSQFQDATQSQFEESGQANIVEMTIPYADAPSTELVLNARFQGVENRILLFDENGTYQQDFESLNTAVETAQDKATIKIAGGTVVSPSNTDAQITGAITIDGKELTITSINDESVTLDGENRQQGFNLSNQAHVTFENLRLINFIGAAPVSSSREAIPTAAAINLNSSTLSLLHTLLASNTSQTGAVAGINNSDITIEAATFTDNKATDQSGSGALLVQTSELSLSNSYFASNTSAGSGGAIILEEATATLTDSTFAYNLATTMGAGIYVHNAQTIINNCLFDSNVFPQTRRPGYFGTGLYLDNVDLTVTVTGSTFKNMEADQGAGIYIASGQAKVYDNSFENLNASDRGGAIYIKGTPVDTSMRLSTNPSIYSVYNSKGTEWKWFNVPNATIGFVENFNQNNNRYIDCTIQGDASAEGAKIGHSQMETPEGRLTLHPEEGQEQSKIQLNINYQIGTLFDGGTLTIDVPLGFEITDNASVTIGENDAKAASVYTPTQQSIDITDIDLAFGTITLALEEQEVPDGVDAQQNGMRNVDYTFSAYADADGSDSAWTPTAESTAVFTSTPLSTNTDFRVTGDDPQLIQYKTTGPATSLKVASETTVATVLANITNVDGKTQTYKICNLNHLSGFVGTHLLTADATLVVTSEHGAPYETEYAILINPTAFVKLEETLPVSEERNQRISGYNTSWHDTISDAVGEAPDTQPSTITVWPGTYKENIIISKPIHLKSTQPEDETTQQTTILDGNEGNYVLQIGTIDVASERLNPQNVIVEGFSITNAMGASDSSGERLSLEAAGIRVNSMNTEIRNNIITKNGTDTSGARGIYVDPQGSEVITITNNTISFNYTGDPSGGDEDKYGAGIFVKTGKPLIHNNTIESNTAGADGGGICLGSDVFRSMARGDVQAILYNNIFNNNKALKGGGIFVYKNAVVINNDGDSWKRFNVPNANVEFVEHNSDDTNNNTYSGNHFWSEVSPQRNGDDEGVDICFEPQETPAGTITAVLTSFMETNTERWDISYSTGYQYISGTVVFGLENFNPLTADATIIIGEENIPLSTYDWTTNTATITNITVEEGGTITLSFLTTVSPASLRNGDKTIKSSGDADGEGKANLFSDTQQFLPEIITNKPINPNPSINKLSVPLDQEFSWENENTSEPFTYDFYLGTNADDLNLIGENLTDLSFAPIDGLNDSTQYFWQIVSKSMTSIVYSPIWSFKSTNCNSSLTYGGEGEDYSHSIVPLPDDGLLVGAISNSNNSYDVSNNYGLYDIWVMKLDSNREIVWEKNYGGSNEESSVRVLVVADGNYLIVANTSSNDHDCTSNHGNADIWMAKVHADNGAIIWNKCFGGSKFDNLGGIELSDEGNIVIVGTSWSSDGDVIGLHNPGGFTSDIWFFEVNQTNGELIQQKCYGGDSEEAGHDISKTTDGGYIIAGSTYDYNLFPALDSGDLQGLTFYGQKDIWIIKIADDGEIEWSQTYGTADLEYPEEVEQTEDGGYLFMAYSEDLWIGKIDTLGDTLFQNKMISHGFFYSMHKIMDQYIVVGHTSYNNGVFNENRGNKDIWQLAFDQDTNLLWKKSFGGSSIDRCFDFCLLPNGNLMTAAITWSTDGDINQLYGKRDVWLFESSIP